MSCIEISTKGSHDINFTLAIPPKAIIIAVSGDIVSVINEVIHPYFPVSQIVAAV